MLGRWDPTGSLLFGSCWIYRGSWWIYSWWISGDWMNFDVILLAKSFLFFPFSGIHLEDASGRCCRFDLWICKSRLMTLMGLLVYWEVIDELEPRSNGGTFWDGPPSLTLNLQPFSVKKKREQWLISNNHEGWWWLILMVVRVVMLIMKVRDGS